MVVDIDRAIEDVRLAEQDLDWAENDDYREAAALILEGKRKVLNTLLKQESGREGEARAAIKWPWYKESEAHHD